MKKCSKILASRIQIPKPFSNMVDRPSLLKYLSKQEQKIVLLNAGAGFGKTLLLSQYANLSNNRCAWYSLSSLDNDIMQFVQYLTKSLQNVLEEFAFPLDEYLNESVNQRNIAQIGYDFSMALEECVNGSLTIILDDFQEINNEEIYELLSSLIEQTSSQIFFFFAVKGSFPKFLARYLLCGKINLFTAEQMAFNKEEIKELLKDIPGIDVLDAVTEKVHEVTEGWPAGVMFTTLALRNVRNAITIDNIVSICMQSTVHDYIMYEIYRKLPYDVQLFLVNTSILTILSTDVCNVVMGIDNSRSILDYLVQENLFTVKLGGSDNVYQYHSIFRFFLQAQIKKEEKNRLLEKTALYCMHSGDMEQAVEYGMMINNAEIVEQAVNLIGDTLMNQGQLNKLNRWFSFLLEANRKLNAISQMLLAKYFRLQKNYPVALEYADQAISQCDIQKKESNLVKAVIEKALILRRMDKFEEANELLSSTACGEFKNKNLYFLLEFTKLENQVLLQKKSEVLKTLDHINCMELNNRAEKVTIEKKRAIELFTELLPVIQEKEVEEASFFVKLDEIGKASVVLHDYLLWISIYHLYREKRIQKANALILRLVNKYKVENTFTILINILNILITQENIEEGKEKLVSCFEHARERHLILPKWNPEDEKKITQILCDENQKIKRTQINYLNVYCLGGFTVKSGTTEIKWRTKKARELFAFLFERQGKVCTKEMIIEALWPELPPGTSSTIFHTTLSYIRKGLSQDSMQEVILTKNRGYGLDMSRIKSDCRIFLNICENVKKHNFALFEGKENILKIYRGRYMEGLEFPWSEPTADYMERLYMEACEGLAVHEIERQDYNSAIYCLKAALELDPYVENLQAMLLKCYGELGNIGHAKQQYEKAKRIMKEDLNVEISEQVTEVYHEYIKEM